MISRQRAWGVPIAVFIKEKPDGSVEILDDPDVNARIVDAFEEEGADAWYAPGARERFLGKLANEDWKKVDDILDVWFNSGSTHAFVLEDEKHFPALAHIKRKADGGDETVMYLEGSDQHRGWFQSSLLEICGTRGRAPFDVVLTHGFVLDEHGRKMSKSLGNVTAPQDVIKQSGADILRMWVCAADYADDLRIGPEILKTTVDTYRKLRNTLRWMLGNLAHFERRRPRRLSTHMPELERLMLHRLAELDPLVRAAYADFDYKRIFAALNAFMTSDLSAFYFDIRKDALYCDPYSSVTRKACLTVLDQSVPLHGDLAGADAVLHRRRSVAGARSRRAIGASGTVSRSAAIVARRRSCGEMAQAAQSAPRRHRRAGDRARSEAHRLLARSAPIVYVGDPELFAVAVDADLAELCITSQATLVEGEGPASAFRLDDVPSSPSIRAAPRAANARGRGKSRRRSDPIHNIPT